MQISAKKHFSNEANHNTTEMTNLNDMINLTASNKLINQQVCTAEKMLILSEHFSCSCLFGI